VRIKEYGVDGQRPRGKEKKVRKKKGTLNEPAVHRANDQPRNSKEGKKKGELAQIQKEPPPGRAHQKRQRRKGIHTWKAQQKKKLGEVEKLGFVESAR